jgi:hypothetical protein
LQKFYVVTDVHGADATYVPDMPLLKIDLSPKHTQDLLRVFDADSVFSLKGKIFTDDSPFESAAKSFKLFITNVDKVWIWSISQGPSATSYTVTLGFRPESAWKSLPLWQKIAEYVLGPVMRWFGFAAVSKVSMSAVRVGELLRLMNVQDTDRLKDSFFLLSKSRFFKNPADAIESIH